MSGMSLAITPLYGAVALLCLWAGGVCALRSSGRKQAAGWIAVAAWFALMIVLRLGDVEETARQALRLWFRSRDAYDDRQRLQLPLALATLIGAALLAVIARRGWRASAGDTARKLLHIALVAAAGFLPLYALRIVSLHITDTLLYSGPVRLNWLADGGLTLLAGAAAYIRAFHLPRRRSAPPDFR